MTHNKIENTKIRITSVLKFNSPSPKNLIELLKISKKQQRT